MAATTGSTRALALEEQYPELYTYLKQRFVSLPEPYSTNGWLVDLRDPFHPVAERYDTWAEAEAACEWRIVEALAEIVAQKVTTN